MAAPEPTNVSDAMRPIRKYLAQGKQLDQVQPQVAYLCRVHAVQVGLKIKQTPEDLNYLMSLMDWLETNGGCVNGLSSEQRSTLVDDFAAQLFEAADNTDRSSGSTQDTCRTFLAVAILLDVCEQFNPLSDDQNKVRRYSTWKAADISRALKQGMRPNPGGPPEIDPFFDADTAALSSLPTPGQQQPQQPQQPQQQQQQQPKPQQPQPQQPQLPPISSTPTSTTSQPQQQQQHPTVPLTATTVGDSIVIKGNLLPREQAFAQVDRLCKHAQSAVAFDDVKTATEKLTQALSLLIPYQPR